MNTDSPTQTANPIEPSAGSGAKQTRKAFQVLSSEKRSLLVLVAVYLGLAGLFATRIPLWEAPDSIWHYHYVSHLASGAGLPTRTDQGLDEPWRQQGSQPPLYYLLTAPLVALTEADWIGRGRGRGRRFIGPGSIRHRSCEQDQSPCLRRPSRTGWEPQLYDPWQMGILALGRHRPRRALGEPGGRCFSA